MRERFISTLKNAGSPRRTAAAFALGVFLSFSPFLGLQTLLGFGTATAFRLSRAVTFAGLCINMPWLMIPWYTLATAAGAFVLRAPVAPDLGGLLTQLFELPLTAPLFWSEAMDIAAPFLWSFVFGSVVGALVLGLAAYVAVAQYLTLASWHRVMSEGTSGPEPRL